MTIDQTYVMRAMLAGLATAFAFMALFSGNVLGSAIGMFSPLPLFYTALTAGLTGTALAVLVAFGLLALQAKAILSVGVFLIGLAAAPVYLAWRMDAEQSDSESKRSLGGPSIGRHLSVIALGGGAVMALSLLQLDKMLVDTGGLSGYARLWVDALVEAIAAGGRMRNADVIAMKAQANALGANLFVGSGAMWLFIMALNAGLASRIAKRAPSFDQAKIAWLQMPRWFVFPAFAFTVLSMSSGLPGVAMGVLSVTLLAAAALQGLSVLHYVSSGMKYPTAFLIAMYTLCFIFNPAAILLALLGLADSRIDLRQRLAGGQ